MKPNRIFQPLLLLRRGFLFLFFIFGLFLIGCGSSTPRFASDGKKSDSKKEEKKKGAIRFSSKEAEEEKKEDDKKVDVNDAAQRFKTKKDLEKNHSKQEQKKHSEPSPKNSSEFSDQKMMDAILAWIGTPYEYGGEMRSGIDCSAFTREIFKTSASVDLPRTTEEQAKLGNPVEKEKLKFGDLIFFNTSGQNPSHVGIYIGDDMFAHASVTSGVTLSSLYSSYYKKRYTEARRVLQ